VAKRAARVRSARGVGQLFQSIEGERWLINRDPCRQASVGCGWRERLDGLVWSSCNREVPHPTFWAVLFPDVNQFFYLR
jgi:hypothetical protein